MPLSLTVSNSMPTVDLLLAQNTQITVWFTPIWLTSVGIGLGFLLVLLILLKVFVVSKIPGINSVAENHTTHAIAGTLLGLVYVGAFVGFYYWRFGGVSDIGFPLLFAIPLSAIAGWGAWKMISKSKAGEVLSLATEGFLGWLNIICSVFLSFAVIGIVLGLFNGFGVIKFADDTNAMLNSASRLPFSGNYSQTYDISPSGEDSNGEEFELRHNGNLVFGDEVKKVSVTSNQKVEIAVEPMTVEVPPFRKIRVTASQDATDYVRREDGSGAIPNTKIDKIYIKNFGSKSAEVTLNWEMQPAIPEVWIVPWAAAFVIGVYFFYLAFSVSFPKVSAISLSTFKTEISQPLFLLVLLIGTFFMVGSIYIPYNTFGEDIKMYKDSGLTMIKVLAIFMAIWAAGKSVAEEIEGRTALTVLSKPVGRRQFILGKFTGISLSVAILFIILGAWFVFWTSYKPIYDGGEASTGTPEWTVCFTEAVRIIPAIFLAFLEVIIFVAISVAISTRFGILTNFLICFSIYVLGHLTPLIVQSNEVVQSFELVVLFSQIISIIFPVLDHFDVQAAINTNRDVPLDYLGWAVIYCFLYGTMAMLLALVLFEDRDLA